MARMARHPVPTPLRLADADTAADLRTYLGRARRADPDGVARLVGHGDVLAVYVSPVHGGGGPVVLGLRTLPLRAPATLDVTVPLAALDTPAPPDGTVPPEAPVLLDGAGPGEVLLEVPAGRAGPGAGPGVAWAGTSPPRRGWQGVAAVAPEVLRQVAAAGIAEVATGAPAGSGAAAVAALRARVWGRDLSADLPGLPAGVAFAAVGLGFVSAAPAAVYRNGPWWRVTTPAGHLLARRPLLGG